MTSGVILNLRPETRKGHPRYVTSSTPLLPPVHSGVEGLVVLRLSETLGPSLICSLMVFLSLLGPLGSSPSLIN